jgi:NitT/TauT family transport system permease protein
MVIDTRPAPRPPGGAGADPVPAPRPAPPFRAAPRARHTVRQLGVWLAPAALGALLLLLWEALTRVGGVSPFVLPAPEEVAAAFWGALVDGSLVGNAAATLLESLIGFALGALVALPLGYAVARSRWLAWAIQPYLAASQALPAVALAPLLVIWLGFGLPPTAALCALIVFFPATITTTLGLRGLDGETLDAARVDGANRWTLLRYVELPLALPAILAGLRASLTLSITGAVVGEFVTGGTGLGLGGLLEIAGSRLETALVFATLVALALLAALLYGFARLIERQFSYLEDH